LLLQRTGRSARLLVHFSQEISMVSASRSRLAGALLLCLVIILAAIGPAQARGFYNDTYRSGCGPFGHPDRYGYDFRFEPAPGYPVALFHEPFAYVPGIYGYPLYPPAAYAPPAVTSR
jgi:hypothetical protein